jgi:VacB/RNase II family 3'-5' exoribonuclease
MNLPVQADSCTFIRVSPRHNGKVNLHAIALRVMSQHGFDPAFSAASQQQVKDLEQHDPRSAERGGVKDMTGLLWSSIDNDTSRDLDQIEVAERLTDGTFRVRIGIADVDTYVPKGSPIDVDAADQATTVYTGVEMFPMLPEELSTQMTSLLPDDDRLAVITELIVDGDGIVRSSEMYRALVRNKAQLAYHGVGEWLEGRGAPPEKVAASPDLQTQLKLQDDIAQRLRKRRIENGALELETIEPRPVMKGDQIADIVKHERNNATQLIEDFMIAANGAVARRLEKVSSIRRIVRTPERWERIVELASQYGFQLPRDPDSRALNEFLCERKAAEPDRFPELSLTVIKLMGPGEYVLEKGNAGAEGHFGLAVPDYTHSTAPNRRYPDVVTQRILKAMIAGKPSPYSDAELNTIAQNCTLKADAARKVERTMVKSIAAVALAKRIGETFDAIVTGASQKGTWVRIKQPTVEGKVVRGDKGMDVGDHVRVKLLAADPQNGFIDFARA